MQRGRFWHSVRGRNDGGGDTGPPKMAGIDRNRLEAGAGEEQKRGGGGRKDRNRNGRDDNSDAGGGVIGSRKGSGEEESLGASGSSGAEWSGAEDLGHTLTSDDHRYTGFNSSS